MGNMENKPMTKEEYTLDMEPQEGSTVKSKVEDKDQLTSKE